MKKLCIICFWFMSMFANAEPELWIKVLSNDVNHVWFEFAPSAHAREQKVVKEWVNQPAEYFVLSGNIVTRKTGDSLLIAQLPPKYRKTGAGGIWEEKTPAEKASADAADKVTLATDIAQSAVIDSLRKLINEKFGNPGNEISQQELIDNINSNLTSQVFLEAYGKEN